MDCANSTTRLLTNEDCFFVENVMIDIRAYIEILKDSSNRNKVLLLPPVNNFRRFLVHKLVEETFPKYNLSTLSIGKLYGRRTVVFPSYLKHMEKTDDNTSSGKISSPEVNEDSKKKSVPIYRPPAVRKRENVARASILKNKEKKTRKPDQQIYVPRAKRLNNSQSSDTSLNESVQDENKCDNQIESKPKEAREPRRSSLECDKPDFDDVEFIGIVNRLDKSINEIANSAKQSCTNNDVDCEPNRVEDADLNVSSSAGESEIKKMYDSNDEDVPLLLDTETRPGNVGSFTSNTKNDVEVINLDDSSCQSCDDIIDLASPSLPPLIDISSPSPPPSIDELSCLNPEPITISPTKSKPKKKTDKAGQSSSPNKSLDVDNCDWEELFDESGEYVDDSLISELMTAIGKVSVTRATQDYRSFQTEEERSSDGECIIEVYGFPSEFRTDDLFDIFTPYRSDRGFQIVWVDDTHALAVFSSPLIADEVLNTQLPFVKTRPLKNAIAKSKIRASNFVQPPATRPKTCVSLARRLVSGHLGMKINVTPKQREAERKLLSDAREQKRLMAKQKFDAWEGTSSSGM